MALRDDQLIHEGYKSNPKPFWIWLLAILLTLSFLWMTQAALQRHITEAIEENPFLQVTNREMSVFLWLNPQHMRAHAARKSGYLPGFQYLDRVGPDLEMLDDYVIAPPELLFLYHTWVRQIGDEIPLRQITSAEFAEFLKYAEEWQPQYWAQAPKGYVELVSGLSKNTEKDLRTTLPHVVQLAFQGWKNYFKEGEAINKYTPTPEELKAFLEQHPHYARPYWRNIVDNYLKDSNQFAPFLKVALYNWTMDMHRH